MGRNTLPLQIKYDDSASVDKNMMVIIGFTLQVDAGSLLLIKTFLNWSKEIKMDKQYSHLLAS